MTEPFEGACPTCQERLAELLRRVETLEAEAAASRLYFIERFLAKQFDSFPEGQ